MNEMSPSSRNPLTSNSCLTVQVKAHCQSTYEERAKSTHEIALALLAIALHAKNALRYAPPTVRKEGSTIPVL